jgi:hypothetical protein
MTVHRKAIVELAMRHKVPLMYFISIVPREGGLISYGIDLTDMFGRAASYTSDGEVLSALPPKAGMCSAKRHVLCARSRHP